MPLATKLVTAAAVFAVACWWVLGTAWERRRGKYLQYLDMMHLLKVYRDETDGLWPASLDALRKKGLVGASDQAGFYRIARRKPFSFDETVPARYLECLRFGAVDSLKHLERADGWDVRDKRTGNIVELVDLAQLDSYERTIWPGLASHVLFRLEESQPGNANADGSKVGGVE